MTKKEFWDDPHSYKLTSKEAAALWFQERFMEAAHARTLCDEKDIPKDEQAIRWERFRLKQGIAYGVGRTLHRLGWLSDGLWMTTKRSITILSAPTVRNRDEVASDS